MWVCYTCEYTTDISSYSVYTIEVASFPGLPCFSSSVCVQCIILNANQRAKTGEAWERGSVFILSPSIVASFPSLPRFSSSVCVQYNEIALYPALPRFLPHAEEDITLGTRLRGLTQIHNLITIPTHITQLEMYNTLKYILPNTLLCSHGDYLQFC